MFNASWLIAPLVIGFSASITLAQSGGLKIGDKLEGEITKPYRFEGTLFASELSITLKAGQTVSFAATVVGKDRRVRLVLVDKTDKLVATTLNMGDQIKSIQLTAEEVSVSGVYKLWIISDRVGSFTVRATDPAASGDSDVKTLEARIERLEKELAEARAQLKALKDKARSR